MNLADEIFGIVDIKPPTAVFVKEWNKTLFVRTLTAAEMLASKGLDMIKTVIMGTVNELGEQVFKDEHYDQLKAKAGMPVIRLNLAIQEHNGIYDDLVKKAKND